MDAILLIPRNLLKLDIVGAFATCIVTGGIFATDFIQTGMPLFVLWSMSFASAIFCIIGIAGYFKPQSLFRTLRVLAVLNIVFCACAGVAWLMNYHQLTLFGTIYFPIEIAILIAIALFEFSVANIAYHA